MNREPKMRLAPEGFNLVALGVCLSLAGWTLFWIYPPLTKIPAVVFSVAAVGLMFFFREPGRNPVQGDNLLLAPADGKVLPIGEHTDDIGSNYKRLSIFLSIFDAHVNRSPVTGAVDKVIYKPGRFYIASSEKAASMNEMNRIIFDCPQGKIIMQQVAGAVARRVVCYLREGQQVKAGERIGFIKFGSRVDLMLPDNIEVMVNPGDRVEAGRTVIGVWL